MSAISKFSLRFRWAVAGLVVFVMLGLLGYEWAIASAQSALKKRLEDRGMVLEYATQSWSPWNGVGFNQATLRKNSTNKEPIMEITAVHVDLLWHEAWQSRSLVTRWQAQDATLTLHDEEGAVTLQHFTTDFVLREDKIEVAHLGTNDGTLVFSLAGQIIPAIQKSLTPNEAYPLNLKPIRAVLEALNVQKGTGPLQVTGEFAFDLRPTPSQWKASLRVDGKQVEWRGLPLQETRIDAQLSQVRMDLDCNLKLARGSAKVQITREGWEGKPLLLKGSLTDSAGHTDNYTGSHEGTSNTLTIASVKGSADLFELARNMPSLAAELPSNFKVQSFPEIEAKDFVWHEDGQQPEWKLASLQLVSPAALVATVREKPLVVDRVTGRLSYDKRVWHFDGLKGRMLGGSFSLDGNYDGRTLNKAEVAIKNIRLANLSPWAAVKSSLDDSELSLLYKGAICSEPTRSTGSGTLELTHAPVVHLPLVDQAYELFPTLLPHEKGRGVGEFQVAFAMSKGMATLDPFKARSESLTVTAKGTVDLNKRRVAGQARANLRGVAGVATAPLSHVLTEMEISGPIDDIQVSPLSVGAAAKNLITGTVKAATGTVTTSAKLSSSVLSNGLSLPFEVLGMFNGSDKSKPGE